MRVMDRDLVNLARAYNMSGTKIFWKVMLPFSMPNLLAGLRIGATLAVIGITVGELVGGEIGLGYLISFGQGQANTCDGVRRHRPAHRHRHRDVLGRHSVETRVLHYLPRAVDAPRAAP